MTPWLSSNSLTELPFHLPGRIYRSAMPFQTGDLDGDLFRQYQNASISVVVLLVPDEDCILRSSRDLRKFYTEHGMDVVYLPIPDFQVPAMAELRDAVQSTLEYAKAGQNVVVHCRAGIGRTGMFLACMAKDCLKMPGAKAIAWVRSIIPGALETNKQVQMAMEY